MKQAITSGRLRQRKKGTHTDYVARQYLGRLGKVDNGIVSVNIYGVKDGITFPLIFEIYKPKSTLKSDDIYQSKPQIAAKLVTELVELGFNIRYVLADSLYGESPTAVLRVLEKLNLQFMVSIRSNHGVWMPDTAKVRQTKWRKFTRTFAAHPPETRYVREVIFGQRGRYTYWDLTTDTKTLPPNSTSYVMTNIPSIKSSEVGNIYGERTWVEYGFRQCKSELGWSDFRLTKYSDIARWWEIISCAFLLVSFQSLPATISESIEPNIVESELKSYLSKHPNWDEHRGWKSALNNLQLLLLPLLAFNLIKPWLTIFGNPLLEQSFNTLIAFVDLCTHAFDSLSLLSVHPFCSD